MNSKQKYLELVDKNREALLLLVSDIIKIPSENPTGSVHDVIMYLQNFLKKSEIPFEVVSYHDAFPIIVATLGDPKADKVILNGHVDVVPAGDLKKWRFDPFCGEITDSKILGRGASDMKAGLSGLLFAMQLLKHNGARFEGCLQCHIVSDEESGGQFGSKALLKNGYGKNAKACIIAEPTSNDNVEVGQKGSFNIKIKAHGISAHGSLASYAGENAIEKMMKVLVQIEKLKNIKGVYKQSQLKVLTDSKNIAKRALGSQRSAEVIDHVTVNIGVIKGGVKDNMVPDYCEALINCRLPIGVTGIQVERQTRKIVKALKIEGIDLEFAYNGEANYTENSDALVQSVVKNAEMVWQTKITPAYQWASSDAKYYRNHDIPTIQFGPANLAGIHSYNEDVDIEDVVNATKVYLSVLVDLLGIKA